MSWIQKSEDSFKATNKLIKYSLYNTSVHCSYYSCIQLSLFIICDKLGIEEEEINNKSQDSGSHNYIINTISIAIREKLSNREGRKFSDNISRLKKRRIVADYKTILIDMAEANSLRQLAYDINENLKTTFVI